MSDSRVGNMQVDVDFFVVPSEATDAGIRDRVVVVIDVLRACTTICAAFEHGAEKVIPVDSPVAAKNLRATLGDHALLCGEREGKRVSGFDLGNSPSEYTPEMVAGKTLVLSTTNGSKVLVKSEAARELVVCSFVNISAVADYLAARDEPVAVILSGQVGRFSLEDAVCGGMLVRALHAAQPHRSLCDAAHAAITLADRYAGDVIGMLRSSSHGSYLESIGFGDDLVACARVDALRLVPVSREGRITLDA